MKNRCDTQFVCPKTNKLLFLKSYKSEGVKSFSLVSEDGKFSYPVIGGVPRFVPQDNYANSFGYQWNKYDRLQLDSVNGTQFSRDRFYSITEWAPENLYGKKVLDVGCGAGRFVEIALKAGASVVALDLSGAVDACRKNFRDVQTLDVVQASIYGMPFSQKYFDYVYSIGVIQHTPDPERSVREIARMVKPGGQIGLWIYERSWRSYFGTVGFKYLLRPWTKKMSSQQVENLSWSLERFCWPIIRIAKRSGFPGKLVMRMLPVASAYLQGVPLSDEDFREWVRLDTFDMYSPAHDHPLTYPLVTKWLREEGFHLIETHPHRGISITAMRSHESALDSAVL
jgi:2-polyprenyl-3-methyl-5-hydroxy-6-metoxy-1,4-benzoquinol methylase